jgi:hypothetical protein
MTEGQSRGIVGLSLIVTIQMGEGASIEDTI